MQNLFNLSMCFHMRDEVRPPFCLIVTGVTFHHYATVFYLKVTLKIFLLCCFIITLSAGKIYAFVF